MQQKFTIKLLPSEASNDLVIRTAAAMHASVPPDSISGYRILKRSIDARSKQAWILLTLLVSIGEPLPPLLFEIWKGQNVGQAKKTVLIAGAGPAGLFAALKLIEKGIKPIIVERGKEVRARRRDLAILNKQGKINPESNYCFGEGGAGTYSDGKLYTRSTKRGDVARILQILVQFGANEKILYEAHPHIGTNKLPQIITNIREAIIAHGGLYFFDKKVSDLLLAGDKIVGLSLHTGEKMLADAVILATGHSARDIFELLDRKKINLHFKPFAMGIRIEHPQQLIDRIQYHTPARNIFLPAASYNLVHQVQNKGVFSFCMCPGGIIAPAATRDYELVVNGWSPSKRDNPFANSGIVVTIEENDIQLYRKKHGKLAGMFFQQHVETKAYKAGGGAFVAPAQRMVDFINNRLSDTLPPCSYIPGIHSAPLSEVLPGFIYEALQKAFIAFGNKIHGFCTNEAVVVGVESRTSSPVRIPRDPETLQHSEIKNLYPAGEGAGYAGGIVSAAIDGERVAEKIVTNPNN